jgi:hypothetical protein
MLEARLLQHKSPDVVDMVHEKLIRLDQVRHGLTVSECNKTCGCRLFARASGGLEPKWVRAMCLLNHVRAIVAASDWDCESCGEL